MFSNRVSSSSSIDIFTGTADAPAIFTSSSFENYPFKNTRKLVYTGLRRLAADLPAYFIKAIAASDGFSLRVPKLCLSV